LIESASKAYFTKLFQSEIDENKKDELMMTFSAKVNGGQLGIKMKIEINKKTETKIYHLIILKPINMAQANTI
jgi:hypothetical protein